jgi:DeoR family deoxyribose operon repressor
MESRREQRITWLLQALRQSDKLRLREAAAQLGVSEMTLRRDLSADDTPVVLLGGHLVLARSAAGAHYLLSDQKNRHVKEKRHAARLAAALIKPHQTLFFDCGTTTPFIIEALAPELPFTGICYSLNIFLALREKPQCRVILCGGEFQPGSTVFCPLNLRETLANLCPDLAFLSAAGVHPRQGATCFNLDELPVKHWALAMSKKRALVVDSSKYGVVRPARMGPLSAFDALISNAPAPQELTRQALAQGVEMIS